MSTRHERRKRAKAKREGIILGLLQTQRSLGIAETVKRNKALPRGEFVVMTDRNGKKHWRLSSPHSFAKSSVAVVGVESISKRGRVEHFYNPADAKRIAKRVS